MIQSWDNIFLQNQYFYGFSSYYFYILTITI